MNLIGRKKEQRLLEKVMTSEQAEFVAVYPIGARKLLSLEERREESTYGIKKTSFSF